MWSADHGVHHWEPLGTPESEAAFWSDLGTRVTLELKVFSREEWTLRGSLMGVGEGECPGVGAALGKGLSRAGLLQRPKGRELRTSGVCGRGMAWRWGCSVTPEAEVPWEKPGSRVECDSVDLGKGSCCQIQLLCGWALPLSTTRSRIRASPTRGPVRSGKSLPVEGAGVSQQGQRVWTGRRGARGCTETPAWTQGCGRPARGGVGVSVQHECPEPPRHTECRVSEGHLSGVGPVWAVAPGATVETWPLARPFWRQ